MCLLAPSTFLLASRRSSISCEEMSLDQQNEKMPEALEKTGGDAKPNHRRARLVNKRLSSADAILSRVIVKRHREAKFNAMISDVSSGLIDEFILEESWKNARRLAIVHNFKCDSERIAMGSKCKLCNAISGSE